MRSSRRRPRRENGARSRRLGGLLPMTAVTHPHRPYGMIPSDRERRKAYTAGAGGWGKHKAGAGRAMTDNASHVGRYCRSSRNRSEE